MVAWYRKEMGPAMPAGQREGLFLYETQEKQGAIQGGFTHRVNIFCGGRPGPILERIDADVDMRVSRACLRHGL